MDIIQTIRDNNLIKSGEVVGVAVSGGMDSMSLLHYLSEHKDELDIDVVAITIDHKIRENSGEDVDFVMNYCKENRIRAHKFVVDALKLAETRNIGIEQAAREARFGMFDALIQKGIVDKIAIAHHMGDQAETILLNILRGSGLNGASGMGYIRDSVYIRPMLDVEPDEVLKYIMVNGIPYVEDETNADDGFSRNFLRNKIMPGLRTKFGAVDRNIVNFSAACKEDDKYIVSVINDEAVVHTGSTVKIPLNYFIYPNSITSRIIMRSLEKINSLYDMERKHIEAIRNLVKCENGKKIDLPHGTYAVREYEYITITHKEKKVVVPKKLSIKAGSFDFGGKYKIKVARTTEFKKQENALVMDADKVKGAVWRTRERGDVFEKFGGGSKPLRTYLIDQKVPARIRDSLPVLAKGSDILCVLGVEISEKVRIDKNTKAAYVVTFKDI